MSRKRTEATCEKAGWQTVKVAHPSTGDFTHRTGLVNPRRETRKDGLGSCRSPIPRDESGSGEGQARPIHGQADRRGDAVRFGDHLPTREAMKKIRFKIFRPGRSTFLCIVAATDSLDALRIARSIFEIPKGTIAVQEVARRKPRSTDSTRSHSASTRARRIESAWTR